MKLKKDEVEKFWKKVTKTSNCWIYGTGESYGLFRHSRGSIKAHRLSWILAFGKLQRKMLVCHKCDNPPCVNPDHLFLGTYKDNMVDAAIKGRLNWPEKRREKHSKLMKNNTHVRGKKWSLEARERFSLSRKGVQIHRSEEWKQKVSERMSKMNRELNRYRPQNQKRS